jgi:glutamine synthetase
MVASETDKVWDHCTRNFLRRQVQKYKKYGLEIQSAFENEFFLVYKGVDGTIKPIDETVFASTGSMNRNHLFINDLADALIAQGVKVEWYYPESGFRQQELNIQYAEAMQAADRQIIYRESVRGVSNQHEIIASILPKIIKAKQSPGQVPSAVWVTCGILVLSGK